MNPIATYSEVRFEASRTFRLFADRIVIRGKETLASDGETGIPLSLLEPHFDQPGMLRSNLQPGKPASEALARQKGKLA